MPALYPQKERKMKQKIFAVCGVKNSGKTTLICRLVRRLSEKGIRTAVIKHDGHDFSCDIPGTDTWKFAENGAYGTACFSSDRMFVHRIGTGESYEELIRFFPDAEVIIIEGAKDSAFPKIEIVRKDVSDHPVSGSEGRFLIVTDYPDGTFEEKTAGPEEIDRILEILMDRI